MQSSPTVASSHKLSLCWTNHGLYVWKLTLPLKHIFWRTHLINSCRSLYCATWGSPNQFLEFPSTRFLCAEPFPYEKFCRSSLRDAVSNIPRSGAQSVVFEDAARHKSLYWICRLNSANDVISILRKTNFRFKLNVFGRAFTATLFRRNEINSVTSSVWRTHPSDEFTSSPDVSNFW